MSDTVLTVFVVVAAPFLMIAFVSWLLHYFVALTAPPAKRAGWITGIGYVAATTFWIFGGPEGDRWIGPFVAMPGALIIFWYWHRDFRLAWIDDGQEIPEGTNLANSDWKVGLIGVIGLLVVATVRTLALKGFLGH